MAPVKRKRTRRVVAPPRAEHHLMTSVWVPQREAVARAGTLGALLPALSSGQIRTRAADFYSGPNGGAVKRPDHNITPSWWAEARIDASEAIVATSPMEDFTTCLRLGSSSKRAAVETTPANND